MELTDETLLQPGENTVIVEITGKNQFPHTLSWSYRALTPANKDACPVRLTTKLSQVEANEGQTVRVTAVVENASGKGQGMAVAIIGLPAGLMVPADMQELRNLVRAGQIDAFEINGRELVLYWRQLAPDAFPDSPALATLDISFISLEKVLPSVFAVLTHDGEAVALDAQGRPRMFQETVSWRARVENEAGGRVGASPRFDDDREAPRVVECRVAAVARKRKASTIGEIEQAAAVDRLRDVAVLCVQRLQ